MPFPRDRPPPDILAAMNPPGRALGAFWSAPLAWTVLAGLLVELGRVTPLHATVVAAVALAGVGGARHLAGRRGGLAGRAAELLLFAGGVAWLIAEPAGQRDLVALAAAGAAAGLTIVGVWEPSFEDTRRRLAVLAAAVTGVIVAGGLAGAPAWGAKALLVVISAAVTARLLTRVAGPALAALAVLALAPVLGPAHAAAWLLPPVAAAGLAAIAAGRPFLAAGAGAAAALLPPAGLAISLGLAGAAARRARSARPLLLLPLAAVLAALRLPAGVSPVHTFSLSAVAAALPLAPLALPFLLPAVALGLGGRSGAPGDARDALGIGLLVLPFVAGGPFAPAAAASLWLLALPAATTRPRAVAASLPWTAGAAGALLAAMPWGGAVLPGIATPLLAAGWSVALLVSLLPGRAWRLAWILPVAGLVWTTPVEGVDRHLAPGDRLELPGRPGGWVLQAGAGKGSLAPGAVAIDTSGSPPLLASRDVPARAAGPRHPFVLASGRGRRTHLETRGVTRRATASPLVLEARTAVVVRPETARQWRARRVRTAWLLGGALLLLLAAELAPRAPPAAATLGLSVLLGGLVAAGSGFAPLARAAFRAAPDLAAVAWLTAALRWWPVLARRRVLAGFLLLAPLAVAQPVLRHPAGDEVYHLALARSLVQDHDLAVRNNLDPGDPAQAIYLRDSRRFIHSPALAVLCLPLFALLGHIGALLTMALLVAVAAGLAVRRAVSIGLGGRPAAWAWALCLLTYPALTFATQLWPAAVGMAAAGILLWAAARPAPLAGVSAAAAAMAVKVRLGLLTLPVAAVAALRGRRRLPAVAGLLLGTAAAGTLLALALGSPLGVHRPAELVPGSVVAPLRAFWGLAWDAAGGLVLAAPLWLVALAGLAAVWRRGGPGERALIVGGALTVLALLPRGEWWGGGSPPARYLAPLLPLVLLTLAAVAGRRRGRRLIALALPWAALAAWVAVTHPLWWFNPTDGGFWLADAVARNLHLPARRIFPSLIRPGAAALVVPAVALLLALWWARRPRAGAAALALVMLSAGVAWAKGAPAGRVEVEDPQVIHRGGGAVPPPGSFFRAAHGIAWRLWSGQGLIVPWRPPGGRALAVRARCGSGGAPCGTLLVRWPGTEAFRVSVAGVHWREYPLPPPPRPGRLDLALRWESPAGREVLVDRVEAVP